MPGPPPAFFNVSRSSTRVTLAWTPPARRNGILRDFEVECHPVGALHRFVGAQGASVVVPVNVTQATLSGLQPGSKYGCTVRASTRKGYGLPASHTVWTLPESESSILTSSPFDLKYA